MKLVKENSVDTEERDNLFMANNIIMVQNGVIVNNPFSYRLEMSHATQWLVENRSQVKKKIGFWFREMYVYAYGGNVEDCFGYAIDYFMESKRRAFRKDYFGVDSTYSVRDYCLSQLKHIVQNYRKDLRGGVDVQHIVTSEEMEGSRSGVIDETLNDKDQLSVDELAIHRDIAMWDEKYEWLDDYITYFTDKNYKPFDIKAYLTYMFLDVREETIEEHIEYVAKRIGESIELVVLVTDDFKKDVVRGDERSNDLLDDITELVDAVKSGWKPKPLRDNRGSD